MLLNDRFLPTAVNSARNSGLPPRCSKRRKAESRASSSSFNKAIKNTNERPVLTLGCFYSLRLYFCVLRDNLRFVIPGSSFYFISLNLYKRQLFTRESLTPRCTWFECLFSYLERKVCIHAGIFTLHYTWFECLLLDHSSLLLSLRLHAYIALIDLFLFP